MLQAGQLDSIEDGVRRLVARNTGPFTGPGTNTYLIGEGPFLVIDPGPEDVVHHERIIAATQGRIEAVIATHTHPDHSPCAATLAREIGAPMWGRAAPHLDGHDPTFIPHRELMDGDVLTIGKFTLRVLHTPGHASNHLCFLLQKSTLLFTGDHLMQGATVVIAPPDGDMIHYLDSLQRLLNESVTRLAPGHGEVMNDAHAEIARVIAHRLKREQKVLHHLTDDALAFDALLAHVYDDVNPRLLPLARCSLQAHLLKLERESCVIRVPPDGWRRLP